MGRFTNMKLRYSYSVVCLSLFTGFLIGRMRAGGSAARACPASEMYPAGGVWTPATAPRGEGNDALRRLLKQVAVRDEVLVAVSNRNLLRETGAGGPGSYDGMLRLWVDSVKRAGVRNAVIVALDEETRTAAIAMDVACWRVEPLALADANQDNHGTSAQKFHILRQFLALGYRVLLSDVDVVVVQNPFQHLHRDADVEALSDGYDPRTAYGYVDGLDDPSMGWSRYVQTMRIYVLNSGLFYIQPSARTLHLMDRITQHLVANKDWDQSVFNMMLWYPSHGEERNSQASVRVMHHLLFMNSRTLFVHFRKEPQYAEHTPVMVHVNYHADKEHRVRAIHRRYLDREADALDELPDASL